MHTLMNNMEGKELICFGAGKQLKRACESYAEIELFDKLDFIADNDENKQRFLFEGREKPVYRISQCLERLRKHPVVLITVADFISVAEQLDEIPQLDNCECYIYALVDDAVKQYVLPKNRAAREPLKIPKVIHYCWFGGADIPDPKELPLARYRPLHSYH